MSSKAMSPTAHALRSSRLFSLPAAISPGLAFAQLEEGGTAPFPTQQAIKTPASSRARGDWGLKRPLPLRSTNKGTNPVVRLNALDTREHITDYASANDHAITLSKFQELGLAITNEAKNDRAARRKPRSVFEDDTDNVDISTAQQYTRAARIANEGVRLKDIFTSNTRWKFDGPYLASMSEGDFVDFLNRTLRDKKAAFMEYVRETLAERMTRSARRQATERGERDVASQQPARTSADVTDEQLQQHIQRLRKDFVTNSELARLLETFLDLPSASSSDGLVGFDSRFAESGPPSTHPSAGLSYIRTDAYMANHPLLGPQKHKMPFEGRNLSSVRLNDQSYTAPYVGIGGLIAREPGTSSIASHLGGRLRSIAANDPATAAEDENTYPRAQTDAPAVVSPELEGRSIGVLVHGGNRVWVSPNRASVDPAGRVKVSVGWAAASAVNVRTAAVLTPEAPPVYSKDRESYTLRPPAGFDVRKPEAQRKRLAHRGRKDRGTSKTLSFGEDSAWGRR